MSRAISLLRGASGVLEILEVEIFVVTIKYDEDQKRVLEVRTFRDTAAEVRIDSAKFGFTSCA